MCWFSTAAQLNAGVGSWASTGTHDAIHRIWKAFGLQPHRAEVCQLSTDPFFIDKVRDVVGLYLNPPEQALVLCVDEKSQCQALERSQPLLPLGPNRPERSTHDYFRHGTVSLFAALDVQTGKIIGQCQARHTQRHFLDFLKRIDAATPAALTLHLVLDNYATHKTPAVRRWLVRHPRFHLHFIPTHSSWLNQVERWFAKITTEAIRRGSFHSVPHLRQTIMDYITAHNRRPNPLSGPPPPNSSSERSPIYVANLPDMTLEHFELSHSRNCQPIWPAASGGRTAKSVFVGPPLAEATGHSLI